METIGAPLDITDMAKKIDAEIHALPVQRAEPIRQVRKKYSKLLADAFPHEMYALAELLFFEYGYPWLAYELVYSHRPALESLDREQVETFSRGLDSWAAVDSFGVLISGAAWRRNQIPDEMIYQWACSDDRWLRRAALVSTIPLNVRSRGGHGDIARTFSVCRMLVDDRDDMVVKALSWALRAMVV
ncbi:MAG: DNA alkylation repair protein, partial [Anaerolineales bacterium]|nr:DNA alkylation repair protein [Anaerolineales bacterium]